MSNEHRIGVVGIVLESPENIKHVNIILSDHCDIISGRMGIPHLNGRDVNVISLIVDGHTDQIGALTGKLGKISGINVKSALTKKTFPPSINNSKE